MISVNKRVLGFFVALPLLLWLVALFWGLVGVGSHAPAKAAHPLNTVPTGQYGPLVTPAPVVHRGFPVRGKIVEVTAPEAQTPGKLVFALAADLKTGPVLLLPAGTKFAVSFTGTTDDLLGGRVAADWTVLLPATPKRPAHDMTLRAWVTQTDKPVEAVEGQEMQLLIENFYSGFGGGELAARATPTPKPAGPATLPALAAGTKVVPARPAPAANP